MSHDKYFKCVECNVDEKRREEKCREGERKIFPSLSLSPSSFVSLFSSVNINVSRKEEKEKASKKRERMQNWKREKKLGMKKNRTYKRREKERRWSFTTWKRKVEKYTCKYFPSLFSLSLFLFLSLSLYFSLSPSLHWSVTRETSGRAPGLDFLSLFLLFLFQIFSLHKLSFSLSPSFSLFLSLFLWFFLSPTTILPIDTFPTTSIPNQMRFFLDQENLVINFHTLSELMFRNFWFCHFFPSFSTLSLSFMLYSFSLSLSLLVHVLIVIASVSDIHDQGISPTLSPTSNSFIFLLTISLSLSHSLARSLSLSLLWQHKVSCPIHPHTVSFFSPPLKLSD